MPCVAQYIEGVNGKYSPRTVQRFLNKVEELRLEADYKGDPIEQTDAAENIPAFFRDAGIIHFVCAESAFCRIADLAKE